MKIRPSVALGALALALALSTPAIHAADPLRDVRSLLQQGQAARALSSVERFVAANPRNAEARFLQGVALAELKRPNDAIAVFRKLTEDYPNLPEPYNNLAVLYAGQRDYDKARDALERAIRTHPSYATAHSNLGDLYAQLANEAYERALALDNGRAAPRRAATTQPPLALIRELGPAPSAPLVVASAAPVSTPAARPAPTPAAPAAAPAARPPAASTTNAAANPPPASAATAPAAPAAAAQAPRPTPPATAAAAQPPAPPAAPAQAQAPVSAPAQTAPAQAAPVPAATPTPAAPQPPASADTSALEAAALDAVMRWAEAWSAKDVKAYLAHYDRDFQTPRGRSRTVWENERRERLGKPGEISVGVDNPRVSIEGERATVRFLQRYRSTDFNSNTTKTLELVRRGQHWRIVSERVGG